MVHGEKADSCFPPFEKASLYLKKLIYIHTYILEAGHEM